MSIRIRALLISRDCHKFRIDEIILVYVSRPKAALPGRGLQRAGCSDGGKPAAGVNQSVAFARRRTQFGVHGDPQHRGGSGDGHAHRGRLPPARPHRSRAGEPAAVSTRHEGSGVPALVSVIRESITTMTLPDLPPEVPVAGAPISPAR